MYISLLFYAVVPAQLSANVRGNLSTVATLSELMSSDMTKSIHRADIHSAQNLLNNNTKMDGKLFEKISI